MMVVAMVSLPLPHEMVDHQRTNTLTVNGDDVQLAHRPARFSCCCWCYSLFGPVILRANTHVHGHIAIHTYRRTSSKHKQINKVKLLLLLRFLFKKITRTDIKRQIIYNILRQKSSKLLQNIVYKESNDIVDIFFHIF